MSLFKVLWGIVAYCDICDNGGQIDGDETNYQLPTGWIEIEISQEPRKKRHVCDTCLEKIKETK